jgi:hypothetical protein
VTIRDFSQAELNSQLEIIKHEAYPLPVGSWLYTQINIAVFLPPISSVFLVRNFAKMRKINIKREYSVTIFFFVWGKIAKFMAKKFGFGFATFAL